MLLIDKVCCYPRPGRFSGPQKGKFNGGITACFTGAIIAKSLYVDMGAKKTFDKAGGLN
jgi:hypothetical protein